MAVITRRSVEVGGVQATAITVELPKTSLLIVTTERGYIMCGALDVDLLNTRLAERGIIAGRALGVKTIDQLLAAPLADVTHGARALGIEPGMTGSEAIARMG